MDQNLELHSLYIGFFELFGDEGYCLVYEIIDLASLVIIEWNVFGVFYDIFSVFEAMAFGC